jgi:ubiquinone/menaquinone biosynthesis C-methylase UbiE/intracellular sulfur oxidation DsrE/DsrF family protein
MVRHSCRLAFSWVALASLLGFSLLGSPAFGQDQSVNPGINDSFQDPDVAAFLERFEVESREVYVHRHEILKACEIQPGQTVADIGAGTGLFTRLFSETVGKDGWVFAVDIAPNFLEHIDRSNREAGRTNIQTVHCTPDSTELPPNSVDVAFICDTYHHFEFPRKTMTSLHAALRPGGRVILIDFHRLEGKSSEWTLNHVRAGQEVFESEIREAGFEKIGEGSDLLEDNYFVIFRKTERSAAASRLVFPNISGHGGVVARPDAVHQPRAAAKVVFDVTAGGSAADINKGFDRVARLLNLYGAAEVDTNELKITIVLHGDGTSAVLRDEAYHDRFGEPKNPNLPLIRQLQEAGVEIVVCGQALNYKGFDDTEVAEFIPIAAAAMTVIIHKQMDGFAFLPIP